MKFLLSILFLFEISFAMDNTLNSDLQDFEDEFSTKEVFDPFSGYNRVITGFNDVFYSYVLTPIAKGYDYVIPDPIQGAVSNFFDNLFYPIRLINNILQGKFANSWDETKRFLINSTIGFAGFSDAAAMHFNISKHDEDFGQTLGYWGVGGGPHIVWPIFGPSNLRDTFGLIGDFFTNPVSHMNNLDAFSQWHTPLVTNSFIKINDFSKDPDQYNNLKKDAIDLYPFLRDSYEQRRNYLIKE